MCQRNGLELSSSLMCPNLLYKNELGECHPFGFCLNHRVNFLYQSDYFRNIYHMRFIKQCVQILFHADMAGILVEAINVVLLTLFL
jgi:hypothetical protein